MEKGREGFFWGSRYSPLPPGTWATWGWSTRSWGPVGVEVPYHFWFRNFTPGLAVRLPNWLLHGELMVRGRTAKCLIPCVFKGNWGGLKLLEIRGTGTLWFHLLSSSLHLLFETRSFNELFLTTSIYVGRSSCDLRRRKKTWLFLPHLFQAVRSERLFNARSPRKSTKRQSKVGSNWVNKSSMEECKQNQCFLFLNWVRPLNHLGITKWRCVLSLPGPMNLIRPKMQAARRLTLAKKEEEDEDHVIFFGNIRWKMENLGMKWVTNFTLKYFNPEQHWSTLDDFFVSVESNSISYVGQNWSTSTTIYRFQFLGSVWCTNFGP